MEPFDLTGVKEYASEIAQPLRDRLVEDICRRVKEAGAITTTAEYEIYRAEQLGLAEKEIKAAIAEQSGINAGAVDMLFGDILDKTVRFEDNGQLQQLAAAYKRITTQGANRLLKNLWAPGPDGKLYSIGEAYDKIMDFAFAQTFSGTTDVNTALRRATKELVKRGVRTIPRKNGSNVSIEYATRSYVMDRMGAMTNAVQQMNHDKLGCDGWEISAHSGPAPDHAPIQGLQYPDVEYTKLNSGLARAIGTLQCKHIAWPIRMGRDKPVYTKQQLQRMLEENEAGVLYEGRHYTLYEAGQKQAELEAHIRNIKNKTLADDALGDKENLQKHQLMLARYRQEYSRYCKATGLQPRSARLQAAGFGRSEATRAAAAAKRGTAVMAKNNSPKMPSSGILNAKKVFQSPQEINAAALLIDAGLDDYGLPASVFSGRTLLKDKSCSALGRAEWSGDVSVREDAGLDTLVHELLHMRSANRLPNMVYSANIRIEEATVQLLAQEICRDNGIEILAHTYEKGVRYLQAINKTAKIAPTDLEFGQMLLNVPLDKRHDWLVERVDDFIAANNIPRDVAGGLRNLSYWFWGSDPF